MSRIKRLVAAPLALVLMLVVPLGGRSTVSYAEDGTCIHVDVSISAGGELLTKGPQIANDGGFGHAGTGLTFTFRARTFAPSQNICVIQLTDSRTWQVPLWPCANYPRPKPARTQSLSWTVTVPLDCEVSSSPGLLGVSLTNGRGSAGGYVNIYAGVPGFVLPDKQARGLFGPFAMQSDPVNSLTGALAAVETDASIPGLGVPLAVTRTYDSNDATTGSLGPGWRPSYSDRLTINGNAVTYLASDGREIGFTRHGARYVVEPGVARFSLSRSGSGYTLTSFDQLRMQFSTAGDLTAVRDHSGQGVVVQREAGRLASVTNGRRSLNYAYNELGLQSTVTLTAPGIEPRVVQYGFSDGRLSEVTSPGGVKTRYGYDSGGRLSSQAVGGAIKRLTTEYDADGRVVSQTDGKGGKTTWAWEPAGIHGKSTMTDPTGGKWINEYERNWLVKQVDPAGAAVTFHYDSTGNLIRVFDGLGHGARHVYDTQGRVVASTDAAGNVTRRNYNSFNEVVAVTDPLGRRTTFAYDSRGNLLTTAYAGRSSAASYDARGLVTSARDVLDRTTRFAYSTDGDLLRRTDPAGRVTTYQVDGWGRPVKATPPRGQLAGAAKSFTSEVDYSADDQPLEQRGPLGVTTRQTYDDQGRLSSAVDGRGGVTRLRYDDAGRLVGVKGPDSSLPEATADFDSSGRLTKQVDASGRPQTFTYDGAVSGNPLSFSDLTGMHDVDGTLTDVSTMSGWASTGALLVAVGCTLYRPCAPAIPVLMQVSAATGMLSAGTAGILDTQACVVKGNCSGLAADIAIGAVASRFPALGAARRDAVAAAAARQTAGDGGAVLKYDPDFALGQLTRSGTAKGSDLVKFANSQGWVPLQEKAGPLIFVDANGVKRLSLKMGSPRTPGSELPHLEARNASGHRIDLFGNEITRRSPSNHVPIEWDLP